MVVKCKDARAYATMIFVVHALSTFTLKYWAFYSFLFEIPQNFRLSKSGQGNTAFSFSPALSCLGSVEFLTGRKRNVFVTAKNQFVAM